MEHYQFDSFHLNVGSGDGAIHILTSPNNNGGRTVQRAFLIDGGRVYVQKTIHSIIQWIENTYLCPNPYKYDSYLMFDAFVITHWDGDHYEGVVEFLEGQLEQLPGSTGPESWYFKRAKYANLGNKLFPKEPQSALYAPWNWPKIGSYEVDKNQRLRIGLSGATMAGNLLHYRSGFENLLGRNFLIQDQQRDQQQNRDNMKTLSALLNENQVQDPVPGVGTNYGSWPAMYCIAAAGESLTQNKLKLGSHHTAKNMSSIVFILVWKTLANNEYGISHYLAADAPDNLELDLRTFMENYAPRSMKLSHHGSASSNPPSNFVAWNPAHIVVSAGSMYGHPRWEILFVIDAWYRQLQAWNPEQTIAPPFFPCKLPAYLVQDATKAEYLYQGFSIDELKKTDPGSFVDFVTKCYGVIREQRIKNNQGLYTSDPIERLRDATEEFRGVFGFLPPKEVVKQWISTLIEKMMPTICPLPPGHRIHDIVLGYIESGLTLLPKIGINIWTDIIAVQITAGYLGSDLRSQVSVVGRDGQGKLDEKIFTATDTMARISEVSLPATSSSALGLANFVGSTKGIAANPLPFPGDDRPRVIDITTGNPTWPSKTQLGHLEEPKCYPTPQNEAVFATGSKEMEHELSAEAWREVYEPEDRSWSTLNSDGEVDNDGESELSDWETLDCRFQKLDFQAEPRKQLPVIYKKVPPQTSVAKVYLACENVSFPEGSQGYVLNKDQPLYGFTDTLHYRGFGLGDIPDRVHTTLLDTDDEVYNWLGRFCGWDEDHPVPTGFSIGMCKVDEWPIDQSKKVKLDFAMVVPYLNGQQLHFSTNTGANWTFSKVTADDKVDKSVTAASLTNMHISRRSLIFGLEDMAQVLNTNLADIVTFMRLDFDGYPLLKFLGKQMALTLNTKKDFHNAVWYRPGLNYETILRLQFHMDMTRFNEWLHTLNSNLSVDEVTFIARKKAVWRWKTKQDSATFDSSIACLCRMTISSNLQLTGVFELFKSAITLTLALDKTSLTSSKVRTLQGRNGALDSIIQWLTDKFQVTKASELDNLLKQAADGQSGVMDNDSILPRRVQVILDVDANGKISGVRTAVIDIEVCLTIGRSEAAVQAKMPVLFLFSFGWNKTTGFYLKGRLWTVIPDTPFTPYDRALPGFEEYQLINPVTAVDPKNQQRTLDLARLLSTKEGEVSNFPAGLPNEIWRCELEISQEKIEFTGAIRHSAPKDEGVPPMISLEELTLDASYTWGTKSPADKGFKLRLSIALDLYLNGKLDETKDLDEQYEAAAKLMGEVKYDKGAWSIEASVINLSISHLINFWAASDRGPILEFLSKIKINQVTVKYEFGNKDKNTKLPSRLTFNGSFTIAEVAELTLDYNNVGGDDWVLTAGLGTSEKTKDTATIGKLLTGFLGEDLIKLFPDAIQSAKIQGANGEKALRMICAKHKGLSIFACLVTIEKVSVWFLQIRQGDGSTKRLLKAAISKISVDVSAFHTTFTSPWEDLFFMWIQDTTARKAGDNTRSGITQQEYDNLAEVLKDKAAMTDQDLLLFKPAAKKPADPANSSVHKYDDPPADKSPVITAGMHLVIVAKGTTGEVGIVLDYLFGTKKQPPAMARRTESEHHLALAAPAQPDPSGSEKGTKAPYQVKLGPLSVNNVGLWFKDGMIGITLDATLLMGPIGLSLLGFNIGVPFTGKYSLDNPPPISEVQWGLKGLIVALDRPPLTVAGGFMRDTSDPNVPVMYTGGLIVAFKPWSFEAMGAYATVKKTPAGSGKWITTIDMMPLNQLSSTLSHSTDEVVKYDDKDKEFTFAFIFVKLNGPLFSVGFADVAGLVGGFGMNSDVLLPTVEQVVNFPFVAERNDTKDVSPVERMQSLMKGSWFTPAEGRYWAAAGLRVTAFQMIAANLVLVIQFGNGSFLLGLFGVATCDVPSLESPIKFAHVELGIVCTFDTNSGIFKLEAQLSPRSFILAPQCHLTGGMALFAWSKGDNSDPNPDQRVQAGDFVFTIGGYHRAFHPPRAYPNPPRLGIGWSLSGSLSVTGEAYFALTPKVLMGGGRIHAALSLGALYAYFDAFIDFLMNFEPFYFQLQARIAVGVRFTLDLWLVTIRINAEISASLEFRGPPFGGVVHVDFWVFGFDVKFGSPPSPPPPVSLDRFWAVVIKSGSTGQSLLTAPSCKADGEKDVRAAASTDTAAILLTCESGLMPPLAKEAAKSKHLHAEDESSDVWYVKAGKFSMLATFQFAVTSAKLTETRIIEDPNKNKVPQTRSTDAVIDSKYQEVYGKPMQLIKPLNSTVLISVAAPEPKMTEKVHILETWLDQRWKLGTRVTPMQSSIWGKYRRDLDPSVVGGALDSLLDGKDATVPLVTGVTMLPPDPARAGDMINKFNPTQDHKTAVYEPDKPDWPLFIGVTEDQNSAWRPRGRSAKWSDVRDKWASVGDATTTKVVDLWAKRLRFDKDSVEADQKDDKLKGTFRSLRGVAPKKLLEKFDVLVPALPTIAVGS